MNVERSAHPRRTYAAALAAVAASVLLAGCAATSSGAGGVSSGPGGSGGSGSPSASATRLTVTASRGDGSADRTWTLTCGPTGGTHPQPAVACAELAALTVKGVDPFAETPAGTMCSEIFGGPQRAAVEGTYRGRSVHATFSRTDGCQVARWDKVALLLVVPGTVLEHPLATPSTS